MPAPAPAIMQEVIWKNDEVMTFAVALVSRALEKLRVGATNFTTDIVPDSERGGGHGIAGSVVTMLQTAHVIEPVGIVDGNKIFYAHRVKSDRPGAKTRHVNVYKLTSRALAESFLAKNQPLAKNTQNVKGINDAR